MSGTIAAPSYQISLPKAAMVGGGAVAVGIGLPLALNHFVPAVSRFEPRLAGAGVAVAAGAAALAIAGPHDRGTAMAVGGITGAVAGAVAGGLGTRMAGMDNRMLPLGILLGAMWGGVAGVYTPNLIAR